MNEKVGVIILRCGDSRNGGVEKAIKGFFNLPRLALVKTYAVAGGAHSREISYADVLKQFNIFASVLRGKGVNKIIAVVSDHQDCGYCSAFGSLDIGAYWSREEFTSSVLSIPAVSSIHIVTVNYDDHVKPIVPSCEVSINKIACFEKAA